jgi:hypothetical protein
VTDPSCRQPGECQSGSRQACAPWTQARSASDGTNTQARSASDGTNTQARSASDGTTRGIPSGERSCRFGQRLRALPRGAILRQRRQQKRPSSAPATPLAACRPACQHTACLAGSFTHATTWCGKEFRLSAAPACQPAKGYAAGGRSGERSPLVRPPSVSRRCATVPTFGCWWHTLNLLLYRYLAGGVPLCHYISTA